MDAKARSGKLMQPLVMWLRMLYEFHRLENLKKPNSVHATYVVIGVPNPQSQSNSQSKDANDDEFMQSSPYVGSQLEPEDSDEEPIPVTAVMLVREQELLGAYISERHGDIFPLLSGPLSLHVDLFDCSDVKSQMQVSSIFMYSVQPASPPDLNVLASLGHTILESQPEDPLISGPKYGMIQNKNVKVLLYQDFLNSPSTNQTLDLAANWWSTTTCHETSYGTC